MKPVVENYRYWRSRYDPRRGKKSRHVSVLRHADDVDARSDLQNARPMMAIRRARYSSAQLGDINLLLATNY